MEKKKLLLVAVSAGLFLVIVIGVSILAFSPKNYSAVESVRAEALARDNKPVITEAPPVPAPAPASQNAAPPVVTSAAAAQPESAGKNNGENVIYINGENTENAIKVERGADGTSRTVINIQSAPPVKVDTQPVQTPPPVKPKIAAAAPPAKAAAVQQPPAKTAARPEAGAKKQNPRQGFWVQAGSFSTKSHADKTREFLATKGIASIVQDGMVNGTVYYRVRIGPYSTQGEANHWLALIKEIDGMENSLVWKSY